MDAEPSCPLHAFGSSMTLGGNAALRSPRLCDLRASAISAPLREPFFVAPAQAAAHHVSSPSATLTGQAR